MISKQQNALQRITESSKYNYITLLKGYGGLFFTGFSNTVMSKVAKKQGYLMVDTSTVNNISKNYKIFEFVGDFNCMHDINHVIYMINEVK